MEIAILANPAGGPGIETLAGGQELTAAGFP